MTNQPKPTASALWREWATNGLTPREIHVLIDDLAALERQLAEAVRRERESEDDAGILRKRLVSADTENAAMREALDYLVALAQDAMRQANNDGAEYDIDGELHEARGLLRKAPGEESR